MITPEQLAKWKGLAEEETTSLPKLLLLAKAIPVLIAQVEQLQDEVKDQHRLHRNASLRTLEAQDERDEERQKNAALVEALRFYADKGTYKDRTIGHNQYGQWIRFESPPLYVEDQYGNKARAALAAYESAQQD